MTATTTAPNRTRRKSARKSDRQSQPTPEKIEPEQIEKKNCERKIISSIPLTQIFRPQPGGRMIQTQSTIRGLEVVFTVCDYEISDPADHFGKWRFISSDQGEAIELSRGGVSIMIVSAPRVDDSAGTFVLRWRETCPLEIKSWTLFTDDQAFWRQMVFQAKFAFRLRTGAALLEILESDEIDPFGLPSLVPSLAP